MSQKIADEDGALHCSLGQRARDRRVKANLSMADAGDKLGISLSQVSRKELGEHPYTPAELVRLAKLYGCKVEDFFKGLKI